MKALLSTQRFRLLVAAFVILSPLAPSASAQDAWVSLQQRLVQIVRDKKDAMVRVNAAYEGEESAGKKTQVIIGSGFFISNHGLILTNASIVNAADRVWVEHQGVAYAAELVGSDRPSNLALLRLDTLPERFGFFHLVDSPEMPETGQIVIRLSMPLRFDPSPRMGLVAGYESDFGGQLFPCQYIRVTVSAGPGEGGAAYVDLSGRLLGIQVGTLPEVDSSYVLPARAALRIRDDLLFSGEVNFGWMGFKVREEASIAGGRRLLLEVVDEDTPAEAAGLLPGDILLQIGDYAVQDIDDLRNAMFYTRVGQFVEVRVLRDDREREFSVRLAKRPDDEPLQVIRPVQRAGGPILPVNEASEEARESPLVPRQSMLETEENRSGVPLRRGAH